MRCLLVPEAGTEAQRRQVGEVIAIHAALVAPGKILYFGGDEHDPGRHSLGLVDATRVFDCATLTVSTPAAAGLSDFFCCGHAFLPSGSVLIAGGTQYWMFQGTKAGDPNLHAASGHFRGLPDTWRYDPAAGMFTRVANMLPQPGQVLGGGRWYPTLVTLPEGTVLALSGHPSEADTEHFNFLVEAFHDSGSGGYWERRGTLPYETSDLYPRAFVLPDSRVFVATPLRDGTPQKNCYAFTPSTNSWATVCPGPGQPYEGFGTTGVLLPLVPEDGYRPRVLLCGASAPLRIDLGATAPRWQPTGPRTLIDGGSGTSPRRVNANAVLLPTGEVAVVGGMRDPDNDPGSAVREIELYRPNTDSWVTMPASGRLSVSRSYHSTALLMPDGRVWVAGSNVRCTWSFHNTGDYPGWDSYPGGVQPTTAQDGTVDHRHLEIEIFEPWYHGRPDRPTFTLPSVDATTGSDFTISSPQAVSVSRVVLLRAGSVTHSFNSDQRYVAVPFSLTAPGTLLAHVPLGPGVLPPGPYLLFIVADVVDDVTGMVTSVPSTGTFVTVHQRVWKDLKPEVDIPLKDVGDDFIDPKGLVEGFKLAAEAVLPDPADWPWKLEYPRPDRLSIVAKQLDELRAVIEQSQVFIDKGLRPPVGPSQAVKSFAFANELMPPDPMSPGAMGHGGGHGGHDHPVGPQHGPGDHESLDHENEGGRGETST